MKHPELITEPVIEEAPIPASSPIDSTPTTVRHIRDMAIRQDSSVKRLFSKVAKFTKNQQFIITTKDQKIAQLTEELDRLKRSKKRKTVPNPNRVFMTLGDLTASRDDIPQVVEPPEEVADLGVDSEVEEGRPESVVEDASEPEVEQPEIRTRSGRLVKRKKLD